MPDPTDREVVLAAIEGWPALDQPWGPYIHPDSFDDLATRIATALTEAQDARRVGPLLTAAELGVIRLSNTDIYIEWGSDTVASLLAHIDALDAGARTMNRENERLTGRVEELNGDVQRLREQNKASSDEWTRRHADVQSKYDVLCADMRRAREFHEADMRRQGKHPWTGISTYGQMAAALVIGENRRLRGLLDEWGRHACDCPAYEWSGTEPACRCGWAEAERGLAAKEPGT